jgi:protein kinase A
VNGKKEDFALKKVVKEKDVLAALKREIIFLTKFGVHPFVVSLVKVFDDDDYRYMLMNLAEGGELWDVIHREEQDGTWTSGIGEEHAKFYAFLLADTLSFIHSKKYVYRDLKAENVLIDSDGYPILCDFGFAKYVPDKTYTSCGTPNYVAPEIITSEGHNASVDWWALGVLLYEMVSGDHPFYVEGMDQVDVFEAIIHEQHPPLPQASPSLLSLLDGLLVKEQSQRLGMLSRGADDIMQHKCFKGMDIKTYQTRKIKAPWIPPKPTK